MNPSEVPQSWRADAGDPAPRPGLEDLYAKLEAASAAVADLAVLAQSILPDQDSVLAFLALNELARLKNRVNPGPTEEDPF